MATYNLVHVTVPTSVPIVSYIERSTTATGPWTRIGQTYLAGGEGYYYDNTAPIGTPVWYRAVYLDTLGQEVIAPGTVGPLTLAGTGTVILSDPLRPWADLEFGFCAAPQSLTSIACNPASPDLVWTRFGDRDRLADAGLFAILDAERPADVYARRKDHNGAGQFLTRSLAAIRQVYELFTVGGPLFLRAPAAYGDADFYLQPGDLSEAFIGETVDQRFPVRLWSFPYAVVDGPLGPQQGTDCANWCAVESTFPTFAALTATGDTFGEIAAGTTVCP